MDGRVSIHGFNGTLSKETANFRARRSWQIGGVGERRRAIALHFDANDDNDVVLYISETIILNTTRLYLSKTHQQNYCHTHMIFFILTYMYMFKNFAGNIRPNYIPIYMYILSLEIKRFI